MKTRTLGQSGIEITAIGLGTNYVGGHNLYENVDEDEGVRLVQRAVDLGVTFIDTADVYGLGRSEELVGKALAGRRDQVVLATKGANRFGAAGSGPSNDPAYLRSALEASLKRLGVDHVDLYYIHRPDETTPPEEAFGALMRFKEEGLIRAAGVSNFSVDQMKAAMKAGPIDALQSRYNLLQREVEADTLAFCAEHGIAFVPWGPLAYGLLGGRYGRDFKLSEKDWRHRSGAFDAGVFERNMDIVDGLRSISESTHVPIAHLATQWLMSRPAVASVITGAKTAAQVEDNVHAARATVSAATIERITALAGG
ncbi:MAG: aldo/keto reductase [Ectothiorhodospiraceae bacterium]|nr:aldo/keto reductase [Ectothiorhodospiraceae bacterium]